MAISGLLYSACGLAGTFRSHISSLRAATGLLILCPLSLQVWPVIGPSDEWLIIGSQGVQLFPIDLASCRRD